MIKFSYKPLWKLMIEHDLNNNQFMERTHLSKSTFYKLKHNENVTTDVLLRICNEFKYELLEIIECVHEVEKKYE